MVSSPWAVEHWPLSRASQARRSACAASEIPLSQRQLLPLGVYFNMKSTKQKQKQNHHHYLYSSLSAVRNLDHLHSFQALISENSHFRNKTPWKCSTSESFPTAYDAIHFFINFFVCLRVAWKLYSAYYKSQTIISIFARFDVEKYWYLKYKNPIKTRIFFKGFFPSGQTSKNWLLTILLTNRQCPIWI